MKNIKILIALILGCGLILGLASCGPNIGMITLLNESSYVLELPTGSQYFISYGKSTTESGELKPGEWIKAGIEKNGKLALVHFRLKIIPPIQFTEPKDTWANYIYVVGYEDMTPDSLAPAKWYTTIIVNKGDDKYITVRDKLPGGGE